MSKSVVFFRSKACPNCRQLASVYDEAVKNYGSSIEIKTVDITENADLAVQNAVLSVPSIIFFDDGKEVKRLNGMVSKEKIEQAINGLLGGIAL